LSGNEYVKQGSRFSDDSASDKKFAEFEPCLQLFEDDLWVEIIPGPEKWRKIKKWSHDGRFEYANRPAVNSSSLNVRRFKVVFIQTVSRKEISSPYFHFFPFNFLILPLFTLFLSFSVPHLYQFHC
jgi:hypothetical protein